MNTDRTDRLIDQTLEVWQLRTSRELSREDAREIAENAIGFFQTLRRWEKEASFNDVGDSSATADAAQQSGSRGNGGPSS